MKAILEIVKFNIVDVITVSGEGSGDADFGGTGGGMD